MKAITFPLSPTFQVRNPITGEPVTEASAGTVADAISAIDAASQAFGSLAGCISQTDSVALSDLQDVAGALGRTINPL
ncbi:hypothetical protein [Burkholderia vietnamiensis]|uniref:hypothetical protein n=1 Tax=Burkholderia vietnamiensis TaxID=60552 RepID=UPI0012DA58E0|nr:hypothetical protein [Burkholderia vietnamiensis]